MRHGRGRRCGQARRRRFRRRRPASGAARPSCGQGGPAKPRRAQGGQGAHGVGGGAQEQGSGAWRSGRRGAGQRRSGARPRPGWPGGGGAHGSAAGPRAGALRDAQAAEAERPRRRDGTPTPAVGDSSGEEVWEEKESARKLTTRSIWAEGDRRGKFDVRGGARWGWQWRPAVWRPIRPGNGSIELEEGWWIFGARLGRSGHEESGWNGEVRPEGRRRRALLGLAPRECEEGEGDE